MPELQLHDAGEKDLPLPQVRHGLLRQLWQIPRHGVSGGMPLSGLRNRGRRDRENRQLR